MGAVLTLGVAWFADLTGRLLAWDTVGYWRTVRGFEVVQALPLVGDVFSFLIGGSNLSALVLLRSYVLHVLVLPGFLFALFYLHFSGVRRVGLSTASEQPAAHGAFRQHALSLLILSVFILGGLVTLATLLPDPTGKEADPFSTPAGIHPPWYFLAYHAVLDTLPSVMPRWSRGLIIELTALVVLFLPFLDRTSGRTLRDRWLAVTLGSLWLLLWGWLVWVGYHLEKAP
jgi:quinol-cytochrome oxidoreductase complex cytochrome b subunit